MQIPAKNRKPKWYATVALSLYVLHQFEEHVLDLRGRPYRFVTDLCGVLVGYIGPDRKKLDVEKTLALVGQRSDGREACAATPFVVACINIFPVWVSGGLAILRGNKRPQMVVNYIALLLVNAVIHVAGCLKNSLTYNSGLATALVLFLPFSFLTLGYSDLMRAFVKDGRSNPKLDVILAIAAAIGGHIVIITAMILLQDGVTSEAWAAALCMASSIYVFAGAIMKAPV